MGNGFGDAEGIGIGGGTIDAEFDDVGDAFAVGHDLAREGGADLGERRGKGRIARADGGAAGTGGEQEHGVVGGGVAVDGDAVEADFDGGAQVCVEHRGLDGGVGEDVDEHGGVRHELRMNHAGTLADSGDADFLADFAGAIDLRRETSRRAKAVFSTVSVVRMASATSLEVVGLGADGGGKLRHYVR